MFEIFQRIISGKNESEFLFTDVNEDFLDCKKISRQVWHPTLKKAGLKKRRAYETRHTAAVLHLSAHESPLYVAQLLGHCDAKLLFEVYAPYIKNAARQDGSAFEQLFQEKSNSTNSSRS